MAQQSKSGTSKRRELKRPQTPKPTLYLEPGARKIFEEGWAMAHRFPIGSETESIALEAMMVKLVQACGARVCEAVVFEGLRRGGPERFGSLLGGSLAALTKLRLLSEAKKLMARLSMKERERIGLYCFMSLSACPEDRDEILMAMRSTAARIQDRALYFDSMFKIFAVSQDLQDFLPLQGYTLECLDRRESLNHIEVETLVGIATVVADQQMWGVVFQTLEGICSADVRQTGEVLIAGAISAWDRTRLNDLADALQGSRYEPELRRRALEARDVREEDLEELGATGG